MVTDLTGNTVASTYAQLLHIDGGLTGTLKTAYDGDGTATRLQLSTTAVNIIADGELQIAGTAITATAAEINQLDGVTLSGTNTGDQTITLTGDVTGSGTGSFAATIAADSVTYDKMQDTSGTDVLLGRSTAGAGTVEEISCTAAGRALLDDADAAAQRTTLGLGIGVDVQAYDANNVVSDVVTNFTAQQYFGASALTSTANSIAWDLDTAQAAKHTATENTTLANPTNLKDGATYTFIWTQDGTTARTLAFGTAYKFPGGTAPTVSTGLGAVDIFTFISDGTNMYGVSQLNFS